MAIVNVGGKINLGSSVANLDAKYGPYQSKQIAFDTLGPDGDDVLAIGLTVGIQPNATAPIVEYWFESAIDSVDDLVEKQISKALLNSKQDQLIAGENIAIQDNIISATIPNLNDYATKEWVKDQNKIKAYVELKPINQYLYEIFFDKLDEDYARAYFTNTPEAPSACSAVRKGNLYGRNFDWTYDDSVEFVTHVPRIGSKNAVLGVSGSIAGLTDTFVASGENSDLYKVIPFRMVDGINEYGMVMNTNVVPNQKSEATFATPAVEEKYNLPASMMIYFVLSNFKTVDEAVNYLRDYTKIVIPQTMLDQDFFLHWMLGDKNRTVLLEIIDGALVITDMNANTNSRLAGKPYLTNFYLSDITFNADGTVTTPATGNAVEVNGITSHGAGLERYNIIVNNFDNINNKESMRELLTSIRYTNAYRENASGNWYSEFVGLMELDLESPLEDFENAFPYAMEAFENRSRGDSTWQTTHSCVYDMAAGKLYIVSQEQFNNEYEFAIELNKPIEIPDPITYTAGYGIIIDSNNNISIDDVDIATVEYVDASISDTMNFIIQERDNEHAGRVAGDNLLQEQINKKQDTLIAGIGITIAEDGKTISAIGSSNNQWGTLGQ